MIFDRDGHVLGTMEARGEISRGKGTRAALESRAARTAKRAPLPPLKPKPVKKPTNGPKPNPVRKPGTPKPKAATTSRYALPGAVIFEPPAYGLGKAHLVARLAAKL